jgi:hypothetical protein
MINTAPILPLTCLLALCATDAHGATVPANIRVLSCTTGGSVYAVVAPGAGVSMNVSASASGSPSLCGLPAAFPQTYFVKTSLDGGKSWQWIYRLSDFGFPTAGGPSTPPVNPPVTVSVPPQVWTCTTDNVTVTCKSPVIPGATP